MPFRKKDYVEGGDQMSKTLKKLTILAVVSLAVIGGIWGGLSATATAETHDEDAIKAEVEAAANQLLQSLNTSDGDLFDSLWLQSEKTTYFPGSQPFRVDGWPDVRGAWGAFNLPPGGFSVVSRQGRVDLVGDDVALWTLHFVVNVRPPGGETETVNGRFTTVYQKVDGKWLIVHAHNSHLPE